MLKLLMLPVWIVKKFFGTIFGILGFAFSVIGGILKFVFGTKAGAVLVLITGFFLGKKYLKDNKINSWKKIIEKINERRESSN